MLIDFRNVAAVQQAVDDMTRRSHEQEERINGLNAAVSTLTARVEALDRMIPTLRAQAAGHGPSVK